MQKLVEKGKKTNLKIKETKDWQIIQKISIARS